MAEEDGEAPIIIKKVKKGGDGAHGGAWKVAYADFVTAMMAFFLLLWLLNATTEEQKRGIADYFEPGFRGSSGAGGFLGGTSRASEGKLSAPSSSTSVSIPLPNVSRTIDDDNTALADAEAEDDALKKTEGDKMEDAIRRQEQKEFAKAENLLRQAIQKIPDLRDLADNLIIDQTPEGLRIQILDQEAKPMFEPGGTNLQPRARLLLQKVAEVVKQMPNKLSISGHTDSTPIGNPGYSNWELSADRANASRRVLQDAGLRDDQVAWVQGKADTEHLFPDDPSSPRNRRISMVLLRDGMVNNRTVATPPPPRIVSQN